MSKLSARFGFLIEIEPQSSSGCCLDQAPIVAQPVAGSPGLQHTAAAAPTSELTAKSGRMCQDYTARFDFLIEIESRSSSGRKPMTLSLSTIKYHFLGDYVQHIRQWGTTDSYSTQLVCI